jgi:YD repeat-containing protein
MFRLRMISALAAMMMAPALGHAIVDMKNSNYADSWIDMRLEGSGYPLRVQRFYNSRSIFSGMFGFGWCSDFETTVERTPEGRLKLVECGAGQEILFSPASFDTKELEKSIDQMVAHYRKTTPGANQQGADTLRAQLRENADLRVEWGRNAGLAAPEVKKGSIFKADNLDVEQISWDGSSYTRTLADGSMQKFDSEGRLIQIYDRNANFLRLTYAGQALKEVIDNQGKKLNFVFQNKRVKEITAPGNIRIQYKYKGEDLIEVRNMWKNTYAYDYDETHNLTKIKFPDNTFKAITYNQKNDWVTSFTDRAIDGVACTETYKYEMDKVNPKDHFWSTATKKCGSEIKNEARFEFWHKTRADGQKYLERVSTKSSSDSMDVTYHPEFGRPVSVKKNGITTVFDYLPNGLVRERSTATSRMLFEYNNQFNKVSKVVTEFFDQKGKVARKRETKFTYDAKSNLAGAENSDGQFVKLGYDARGRIASIIDQAKKEVQIRFDERTGKPSQITRPKVGTINISYKPNGEINKIESSDGPTVAVQIASTFNNLLDIIAPATSELNL